MISPAEWIGIGGIVIVPLTGHYLANKDWLKRLFMDRLERIEEAQLEHNARIYATDSKAQVLESRVNGLDSDLTTLQQTCERRHIQRTGGAHGL